MLMGLFYNRSCFWFLFSVGLGPVTYKVMFQVHVCDWSPALRIPLCIAMFTMPPGLWILPLRSCSFYICYFARKVLYFLGKSIISSLYFCHFHPSWTRLGVAASWTATSVSVFFYSFSLCHNTSSSGTVLSIGDSLLHLLVPLSSVIVFNLES